eukprot:1157935-Pelagomonas_calceolata.AAC.14
MFREGCSPLRECAGLPNAIIESGAGVSLRISHVPGGEAREQEVEVRVERAEAWAMEVERTERVSEARNRVRGEESLDKGEGWMVDKGVDKRAGKRVDIRAHLPPLKPVHLYIIGKGASSNASFL